jgi:predicted membrane channel-forming protein YqfA (hemolysin III family)
MKLSQLSMLYYRIAGQVYTVDKIVYELPDKQYLTSQPWQIYSKGDTNSKTPKIHLTFQPWGSQEEHIHLFVVAGDFVQVFGVYNGTIELFDHTYVIENGFGVAENHYAKW